MNRETIGFIGTGVMGLSMAGHLLKAGYPLNVYNRTKSKADPLISEGAVWRESIAELAEASDVMITIVGYPEDVRETYLSPQGVLAHAKPGSLFIDMTTSSPELAKQIASEAAKTEIASLDAPVSGGDLGAKEARLSIMVGGETSAFERALPLFEVMGKNIVLQGAAGSGQFTKMCNQIAIAPMMLGVCEAMLYAKKSGLDPQKVLQSIESGAAGSWTLSNLVPRALKGNYEPGFYVKHFIKDMSIALESAESMGIELPGLNLAKKLYEQLAEIGGADQGTQALFRVYLGE